MALASIYEEKLIMHISYDVDQNMEYFGKARPGTLDDENEWTISKVIYDVNINIIEILFADGNNLYNKQWDLRSTYSYS
jgi:hypothetical protein